MKRLLKWALIMSACGFALIQFARPAQTNPVLNESRAIEASVHVTPEVQAIFARACNDCHTNRTSWPWYSQVAPVSWWLTDHVQHGRRHMNFSDWARYDTSKAETLLGAICITTKEGVMPLPSYTLMHRNAILTPQDVGTLCAWSWTETQRLADVTPAPTR
ncbi:MAG: heme-binding domain-containing protein [Pyrinomonadaceae bacterium]